MPGVVPIEVWDLPIEGRLLQEWRHAPDFARRIGLAVHAIREGVSEIAHVHLLGGGVNPEFGEAVRRHGGVPTSYSLDAFAPARAGATLRPGALCADVGQTAIKLVDRHDELRVERDLARAPLRDDVPHDRRAAARVSTIQFLGAVLAERRAASAIVLGLPCELGDDGIPRGCTYCWRDPDPDLVPELSRLARRPISVVNDAELAAVAAAQDAAVPHDRTTLVLTIGFGVGGALLRGQSLLALLALLASK